MTNSKPTWTPMATSSRLTVKDTEDNTTVTDMEIGGRHITYSSVVGSLIYAIIETRPDIAYAVGVLRHFSSNPKRHYWNAAK